MEETLEILGLILLIIVLMTLLVIGLAYGMNRQNECNARGGVYVAQAIGYGCLK